MLRQAVSGPTGSGSVNNESGNVALAVMVLMLSAALAATSLSQSRHALHTAGQTDDRAAALGGAERGLAEASAAIRNGQNLPFSGSGSLQSGTYSYDVTFGASVATVQSTGVVRGATRTVETQIQQTVESTVQPQPTVFARSFLTASSGFGSISGRVATNGTITFTGAAPGDVQQVYSPNGFCNGCPNLLESPGQASYQEPVHPSGPSQYCDLYQWFDGVVDGGFGVPFLCEDGGYIVFFQGMQIINPPLIVYTGNRDVYIWDADVNRGGAPSNFQVYVTTHPVFVAKTTLRNSDVSVQFYAPGRRVTPTDYRANGRHVLNEVTLDSGASVHLRNTSPDELVQTETWALTSWRVVPNP